MDYWLSVLAEQIPAVAEKAVSCEGATPGAPLPNIYLPLYPPRPAHPLTPTMRHPSTMHAPQFRMGGRAPIALALRG